MSYQTIYDRLRAAGLTEAGALGMLGNWDCESNCIPYRVQGDFTAGYTVSKQYTADVDSGKISKQQFQNDQKGYGLAQWTYWSRKAALYDYWKYKKGSIGDEAMQVDYSLLELKTDFSGLLSLLQTSNDLYDCTKQICYKYENPAFKNVDQRYASAMRIRGEIDLNPQPVPPEPDPPGPDPDPKPEPRAWPPRDIDWHCTDFPEVTVLTSILYCRGYLEYAIGYWDGPDGAVTKAVERFQKNYGLLSDGVVGNNTWDKLLERR